jgi:hypothetical protein
LSIATLLANTDEPKVISFRDIFAFPETMILWSQASASMHPPAIAWPFNEATRGFG